MSYKFQTEAITSDKAIRMEINNYFTKIKMPPTHAASLHERSPFDNS